MFSLVRCTRQLCHPLPRRCISSSVPRRRETDPDADASKAEGRSRDDADPDGEFKTFKAFLQGNEKYKIAKPRNWMGETEDAPFPMNPSFKPPTPISDTVRTRMYSQYMKDPQKHSIRALSQEHHVSLKRVEAILRLKGLEAAYVKENKPLQTGFRWGMEMLLGVKNVAPDRDDVHAADMLEQEEHRDAARQRFQRQYWESIADDGKEPILPASLESAQKVAKRYAQAAEDHKSSNPRLMPRFKDTDVIKSPRQKIQRVVREGRMPIHFVDVGGKFIDVDERLRRMAVAERRGHLHARRSDEKVLKGYLRGRTPDERARRALIKREQRSPS
ncbi:eukaryotic mitochondrial regulator protein-domain-containing protein [Mycena sp. CBHHK59/15]|nr:eukaryotic mitochondrial regulator protein-domain-containing protein [Mycena sp. CBHHK59/15]